MHPVPCELDTLVLDTYEKYEALMQEHHMNFSVELPDEEFPLCSCDPERISQVLGILLDNVISYVPEHGKIQLTLTQNSRGFCLAVIDNGPGIPDSAKTSDFLFIHCATHRSDSDWLLLQKEAIQIQHRSL